MRDLFLATGFPPDVGGIQRLVYEVASRFENPVVITRFFKGAEKFDAGLKHFTIHRTPNKRSLLYKICFIISPFLAWFVENRKYLQQAIRKDRITRIHCTHIYTGLCGIYAKYRYGIPFVTYVYCQEVFPFYYPWYNPLSWFLRNLILRKSSQIYTITVPMKDYISQTADASKITVIPLAADPQRFYPRPKNKKVLEKYGLNGKKIVLTISRFEEYKGIDKTIEAIAKLIKKFPDIIYLVVGDGEDRSRLERIVSDLQVSKHVMFTGEAAEEDMLDLYNLAEVYILANRDIPERGKLGGYGMVLLEANACEKPIVVGRAKYFDADPIHGKTGIVVNPFDVDEIAHALGKILIDESLARRFGKTGRENVIKTSNYDNMAKIIANNLPKGDHTS